MKTSNKLLIGSGICILLGIITHTFILRGAYLDALKNPVSDEVNIGLKTVKYLNLEYNNDVTFKKGNKFEIIVSRDYKDSLTTVYKNDSLNLDITKLGEVTILLPNFPQINFIEKRAVMQKGGVQVYGEPKDYKGIYVDSTFQSGNFVATFQKNTILNFYKSRFDKIDVKGHENVLLKIEKSDIKQLNLDLVKFSSLAINYSTIQAKNVVLGDSCNVSIVGKEARTMFLK
jgi:hypothetical protein